jgi:divalent metal cation (Fe/Co/Zn/Cd) transporter
VALAGFGLDSVIEIGASTVVLWELSGTGEDRQRPRARQRGALAEGRVTMIDGLLAVAVLMGLALNAALSWWWGDPLAGLVTVHYSLREARSTFKH